MKRYRILGRIGAGGVGTVYKALDRLTGHQVAIKRIEQISGLAINRATDSAILQNLAHEFRVLAGIRHPNIISVLDYGFDDARQPYFTMELLENAKPITEAAQVLSFNQCVALMMQLLQAIAYLHSRSILHRDLKPTNVLVSDGHVRLLDFGLAALGDSSGEFAGTTAYMPPEMLQDRHYIPASDLYVAGVLFVEMLTGHLPAAEGDVLATLNDPPDLSGLENTPVYDVLVRLLQKDPASRYPDAHAALSALGEACEIIPQETFHIRDNHLVIPPFTGRDPELTQLSDALQRTLAGYGTTILLGGESGVGKSRLIDEVRTMALTTGAFVMRGQSVQEGGLPYQLWREPLAHLAVTNVLTTVEAGIVKALLPEQPWLTDHDVKPAPLLNGEAEQQRLAYTLVSLIRRLNNPIILLLEDLQWARESLGVLQQMMGAVSSLPLMIVGTFRSDTAINVTDQLPDATVMMLERFSRPSVEALCASILGKQTLDWQLVNRLYQESEGNAFFLIEILHTITETAASMTTISADNLPDTLFTEAMAKAVQRRLAFAPDWTRPLLNIAAVAGRNVNTALLNMVARGTVNVDDWLYACTQATLLEAQGNQWRFAHDKLRESLLAALSPTEKTDLHREVAQALETLYADDKAYARQLVDHWYNAGDTNKALHYTLVAGEYLRRIGDFAELQILAQRGLDLLRPFHDDRLRAMLWEFMGDASRYSDVQAAEKAYQLVIDLHQKNNWNLAQSTALKGLSVIYRDQGDIDTAEQLVDLLLTQARQEKGKGLTAALSLRARFYLHRGEYEQAQLTYQECLDFARQQHDDIQVATHLMNLGAVACMQGQSHVGRRAFQEAEQIAATVGAVDIVVYCLLNQANLASDYAEYDVAETYFDRCIPMIESLGDYSLLSGVYYDYADMVLRQNNLDDAHKWYQKSYDLAARLQNHRKLCDCLHGLGKVAYLRQDFVVAEQYILNSQHYAVGVNMLADQVSNLHYLTLIYLNLGKQTDAQHVLRQGLQLAQKTDSSLPQLEILLAAIEFLLFMEQPEQAAILWGVTRHHPDVLPSSFKTLDAYYELLKQNLTHQELGTGIERGKTLTLQQTIDRVLTYVSPA